jgi:hypothetical protein
MNRTKRIAILWTKRAVAATLIALAFAMVACSDVGDSSVVTQQDSSVSEIETGPLEAAGGDADAATPGSERETGPVETTTSDDADSAAVAEAGGSFIDSGPPESAPSDVSAIDATFDGTGGGDAGLRDASGNDGAGNGGTDADAQQVEVIDAAGTDSSAVDDGGDGPSANTGDFDSSPQDSGTQETGIDAGGNDAGAVVACTGPNTPAGCLPCKGNASGVCTPTEAIVLNYDIAKNNFNASAPTTAAASCYYCLVAKACLDSAAKHSVAGVTTQGKSGLECEDPLSATNVAANNAAQCRDTLACTLISNHCSTPTAGDTMDPNDSVSNCYCGSHLGAACTQAPPSGGPNGVCKANQETDLGVTDPTTILANFVDGSKSPGAVGNEILNCALTASCGTCFQ